MDLNDSRANYNKSELREDIINPDPFRQFEHWYKDAKTSAIHEANAMVIATATAAGKPSARIVLLKEVTERGFIFYTNYDSRKGKEIAANPQGQLLFFWDELERQVRIEGQLEKVTAEVSDKYFYSRPEGSQYGAIASPQSAVIPSREYLEAQLKEAKKNPPTRPQNWGGYILIPDHFEFWQGRPSRLHDRIVYRIENNKWKIERLAP